MPWTPARFVVKDGFDQAQERAFHTVSALEGGPFLKPCHTAEATPTQRAFGAPEEASEAKGVRPTSTNAPGPGTALARCPQG